MSATCRDQEWIEARIEATKAQIVAYEDAITALSSGAQMYQLDTGQTRTLVQRSGLGQLRETLTMLENRLSTLQAKLYGAGVYVRPGW